jgi:hypothetical protein
MPELLNSNEIFFTQFETKTRNRFILGIDGIPAYILRKCDRPKVQSEKKTLDHINLQRYYKGKTTWQDITAILYDPVVPSAAQSVMEWIRLSHESVTGRDGYQDFYKKDLTLNILGPVGDKVEEWLIKNAWVQNADFGDVDWTNTGDPCEITITIVYDYAILQY